MIGPPTLSHLIDRMIEGAQRRVVSWRQRVAHLEEHVCDRMYRSSHVVLVVIGLL